jgi:PAS domain S-box-containing protein
MTGGASRPSASAPDSWQSYRFLADNAIDVILEADLQTVIGWVSPSVTDVLGWEPSEIVGLSAAALVHPEDLPEIGMLAQSINDSAVRVRATRCRLLTKAGPYKAMRLRGRPALADDGLVVGHIITFQDTSERDDALRALSVLSEGNRVLARAEDEAALLQQMCEAIVASGGYPLAWYGARVDDAARSVVNRACAGPSREYADRIEVSWGEGPLARGPRASPSAPGRPRCATAWPTTPSSRRGARPPRPRP